MSRSDRTARAAGAVRAAGVTVGVALLVLILLEGALRAVFRFRDRDEASVVSVERLASANPGQAWVDDYPQELERALREQWRSYVYWRSQPFAGKYVNIDAQGLRRTWNRSAAPAPGQRRIFMFGGSTMWGYGARDEYTIASLVSRQLAGRLDDPPWVVNFGEAGYVSTQDVLTLMLELRRGNVPDLAVFYDGVNDSWAAFQSGAAGIPQNELNRVLEFNTRDRLNWRGGFVEHLALYRVSLAAARLMVARAATRRGADPHFLDPALAESVIHVYLGNVRLVDALARAYGFRAVFFWQPTIYSKTILSPEEDGWRLAAPRRAGGPPFAEEYRAFNAAFQETMRVHRVDGVHDLSGVFAGDRRTIFIDRFHISETGNAVVAGAIATVLEPIIQEMTR